jgi:hypothetical protein
MKPKQQTASAVRSLDEYRKKFFPKAYQELAKEKELVEGSVVLSSDTLKKLRNALASVN